MLLYDGNSGDLIESLRGDDISPMTYKLFQIICDRVSGNHCQLLLLIRSQGLSQQCGLQQRWIAICIRSILAVRDYRKNGE